MRLGKNMKHALAFAKSSGVWHGYANNRPTREAIQRLESLGLVETNKYNQFRVTQKGYAHAL
jgi:ribosomal protein S19E (S16A)